MGDILFNGNNFFEIKKYTIEFWGINVQEPFGIDINKKISKFVNDNNFPINEVCEFTEDKDYELYKMCLSYKINLDSKDERVILMNKLVDIGVENHLARIIVLETASSQIIVNKAYLADTNLPENLTEQVLKEICKFYTGEP